MYTGTLIDDLINTVQKAETEARTVEPQKQSAMIELQMFMAQMQQRYRVSQFNVGIA